MFGKILVFFIFKLMMLYKLDKCCHLLFDLDEYYNCLFSVLNQHRFIYVRIKNKTKPIDPKVYKTANTLSIVDFTIIHSV